LFVGTIKNQFEYFIFNCRRKDAKVWRWYQRWRIVRSPRRVGGQCQTELLDFLFEECCKLTGKNRQRNRRWK